MHRRERLERIRVCNGSREMLVPEPPGRFLTPVDTGHGCNLRCAAHILRFDAVNEFRGAEPDEEDIPVLELDAVMCSDRLNVLDSDAVSTKRVIRNALLLCIRDVIDQDTTADHAASGMPVVNGGHLVLRRGLGGHVFLSWIETIVGKAGRLVVPVDETIPLAAVLRVELQLVIPADGVAEL